MKNYLYLVVLGLALAFTSCSKDEKSEIGNGGESEDINPVSVTVKAAGTLETTLKVDYAAVREVKITGPLDAKDCAFISSKLKSLVRLDLLKATFVNGLLPHQAFQVGDNPLDGSKRYSTFSEVVLPESLKFIGENAFTECAALKTVVFPTGLLTIETSAFSYCTSLDKVVLPVGLTDIRESVFYHCTSLVNISLPESLEQLDVNVFGECESLVTIKIPSQITILKEDLFVRCKSLKTVDLPENLIEIYSDAFNGTGLASITLPPKLLVINNRAFSRCDSLTEVVCKATTPPMVLTDVFNETPSAKILKVPTASLAAYKEAPSWSSDFAMITAI